MREQKKKPLLLRYLHSNARSLHSYRLKTDGVDVEEVFGVLYQTSEGEEELQEQPKVEEEEVQQEQVLEGVTA